MKRDLLNALVLLIVFLTFLPLCQAQSQEAKDGQTVQFELVAKYKKNTLFDVSPDGNLVLLYGASTPKKDVKSGGVTEWKQKRGEKYLDILRVVEWASGRELGSLHVHAGPLAARFVGGSTQICYQIQEPKKGSELWDKKNILWDYASGQVSACLSEPNKGAYIGSDRKYESPEGKFVAETSKEKVREVLTLTYVRGVVTIFDKRKGEKIGAVQHPTVREPYDWPLTGYVYSVAITSDGKHLMTSYEGDTYIWHSKSTDGK
jgi:hypothetical protein